MAKVLTIEARRSVYRPEDIINRTYTVRDLIEYLEQFDGNLPVVIQNDGGYTFGAIDCESFGDGGTEDDEDRMANLHWLEVNLAEANEYVMEYKAGGRAKSERWSQIGFFLPASIEHGAVVEKSESGNVRIKWWGGRTTMCKNAADAESILRGRGWKTYAEWVDIHKASKAS